MVGTEETRLVVIRGNSASGKSSVAAGLRERFGRGLALVGQDNLRRIVLRERDRPGAANIGLIDLTARCLHQGERVTSLPSAAAPGRGTASAAAGACGGSCPETRCRPGACAGHEQASRPGAPRARPRQLGLCDRRVLGRDGEGRSRS